MKPDEYRSATGEEAALFQAFVAERVRLGGELRSIMLGTAMVLGNLVAVVDAAGYREASIEVITNTIRYNALLHANEAGSA